MKETSLKVLKHQSKTLTENKYYHSTTPNFDETKIIILTLSPNLLSSRSRYFRNLITLVREHRDR